MLGIPSTSNLGNTKILEKITTKLETLEISREKAWEIWNSQDIWKLRSIEGNNTQQDCVNGY